MSRPNRRERRKNTRTKRRNAAQGQLAQAIADHKAGRVEAAEKGYEAVLASAPRSVPALQYLGVIRAERGDLAGGLERLNRAATQAPTNGEVLMNLAVARRYAEDYAGARQAARKCLQFEPDNTVARYTRGMAARRLGDNAAAQQDLDQLLAAMGDKTPVLYERGMAALALGESDTAAAMFDRAAQRIVGQRESLTLYAEVAAGLHQVGDLASAQHVLDRAVANQETLPGGPAGLAMVWRTLAAVRRDQGQPDAAAAAEAEATAVTEEVTIEIEPLG